MGGDGMEGSRGGSAPTPTSGPDQETAPMTSTGRSAIRRLLPRLAILALMASRCPAGADTPHPEAAVAIEEADETFPSHGKRVAVERFAPKGPGRYPLIVVL